MKSGAFVLTLLCAVVPLSLCLPVPEEASTVSARQETIQQATDRLLFSSTMSQFISARNARNPASLDWSSDGCSMSPDNPGFNFLPSCYRHDFGYRNYKVQSRFTDAAKDRIDEKFRSDMYDECATEDAEDACRAVANVYYWAVQTFGRMATEEEEAELLGARSCGTAAVPPAKA